MISATKREMAQELTAWCASQGLSMTPLTVGGFLATASLTPTQRAWLVQFRDDYSDAADPQGEGDV